LPQPPRAGTSFEIVLPVAAAVLTKPADRSTLLRTVRDVLDRA
jgi:hypothetical protein